LMRANNPVPPVPLVLGGLSFIDLCLGNLWFYRRTL